MQWNTVNVLNGNLCKTQFKLVPRASYETPTPFSHTRNSNTTQIVVPNR